jgi:hypothetical protein
MAYYKNANFLIHENAAEFDVTHPAGNAAPFSGIYRCTICGRSAVSTVGHPLPPQNHHQHPAPQPIKWQLVVKTHFK